MLKNKILYTIIALLCGCGSVFAQGQPSAGEYQPQTFNYSKKPLYRDPLFSDMADIAPRNLLKQPLSQLSYDFSRRLHFGFVFSVGALDYSIRSSKQSHRSGNPDDKNTYGYFVDVSSLSSSLGVSALLDLRINHSFSLRTQLGPTFGSRDITFFGVESADTLTMTIESVLLELPILLKYKAVRAGDLRPYLIGGLTPYLDVAAFKSFNVEKGILVGVNPFDMALTLGAGFDYYANFFKFSLEVKYVHGLINNISKTSLEGYEQYPSAIDRAYARSFVLSLIFE